MNVIIKLAFEVKNFPIIFIKRTVKHSVVKPDFFTIRNREDEFIASRYRKSQKWVNVLALLHRRNITWHEIREWMKKKDLANMKDDQRFILKRHQILGPDIATAQFVTVRGGKVRLRGSGEWLDHTAINDGKIPCTFDPNIRVEAIDASNTKILYEGFDNFTHLLHLKELILRNCVYVDDFVLHKLHIMQYALEKLDISGCINVTEYGICSLHSLKQLKLLIVEDTPNFLNKELTCILLQDVLPQLQVQGVDFENPALFKRLKKFM